VTGYTTDVCSGTQAMVSTPGDGQATTHWWPGHISSMSNMWKHIRELGVFSLLSGQ